MTAAASSPVAANSARAALSAASPEARDLLQEHIWRGAARGERTVAVTRAALATLVLGQVIVLWALGLYGHHGGLLLVGVACLISVAWSAWILRGLKPGRRMVRLLMLSTAIDSLVAFLSIFSVVGWPFPGYGGAVRYPGMAIFAVVAVAAGVRLSRRVALLGAGLAAVAAGLLLALDYRLNSRLGTFHAADFVLLVVVFVGAAVLGYKNASRTKKLVFEAAEAAILADRARRRLGVYLPEPAAKAALESGELRTGGRRQQAAILFSDLRGFTRYSENLPPEQLVGELNAYLDAMVQAIGAEGGVVDKYIGDSVMVVFGIPEERPDDAARAIRCAQAMRQALAAHNRQRAEAGRPPFHQGIGAHFGPVVAGNIGNADRLQFTVIGDAVNVAARLEAATKELGAEVVLSSDLVEAARRSSDPAAASGLRSLGRVAVRGREAELDVFSLSSEKDA